MGPKRKPLTGDARGFPRSPGCVQTGRWAPTPLCPALWHRQHPGLSLLGIANQMGPSTLSSHVVFFLTPKHSVLGCSRLTVLQFPVSSTGTQSYTHVCPFSPDPLPLDGPFPWLMTPRGAQGPPLPSAGLPLVGVLRLISVMLEIIIGDPGSRASHPGSYTHASRLPSHAVLKHAPLRDWNRQVNTHMWAVAL